jgi:uncharacterized protein (TIGR02186 family)
MDTRSRYRAFALGAGLALALAVVPAKLPQPRAESVNTIEAGASQNYFYIEPTYDGTSIVLFGSIDRQALNGRPFDLAVTIEGPIEPVTVWKKDRLAGLWVNTESLTFEGVPNYYAVLSTRPVREVAPIEVRKPRQIGLDALALPLKAPNVPNGHPPAPHEFQEALIRLKKGSGLFSENSKDAFDFFGSRLFRSRVYLPASAGPGVYRVKFYVLQDGKEAGQTSANIRLKKIGIEARLSSAAMNYPWFYGFMAVAVAAVTGGGASLIFRRK